MVELVENDQAVADATVSLPPRNPRLEGRLETRNLRPLFKPASKRSRPLSFQCCIDAIFRKAIRLRGLRSLAFLIKRGAGIPIRTSGHESLQ